MYCPYDDELLRVKRYDYHHTDKALPQPYNTFLTVLRVCSLCGTTVETSQQVRITNKKEE